MSVKEIEDKKTILHTLGKDELISMIHELLVNIKKSKNRVSSEKQGVRFLERHLRKIKDQIDKVLKTKVVEGEIWTPPKKTSTFKTNTSNNILTNSKMPDRSRL